MRLFLIALLLLTAHSSFSQSFEPDPWDRLGLSKTEWLMIQDNNIPMKKVEQLLKSGIDISEYLQKPWENIGLSEEKWISKRRAGMTSESIENEQIANERTNSSYLHESFSEFNSLSGTGPAFSSLLLPGFQQFKDQRKAPAIAMVSLAASSLVLCTAGSIQRKQFFALPVFAILVPDMVWSYIDYKVHSNRKKSKL
ncbi:MAG: hypothetical protein GX640_24520 [Fibrobacter sp.]|nr:hypothetical protein [Fibrobacter sp.]